MMGADFSLKIADFGFAAPILGRDGKGELATQLGTPAYMAPEIHYGRKYEGSKVDIFASGIILFIMVLQRPPFECAHPERNPHYQMLAAGRPDMFWEAHEAAGTPSALSPEFKDLFERMLALNPKERITIQEIVAHPWLKGTTATASQIATEFKARKTQLDANHAAERD